MNFQFVDKYESIADLQRAIIQTPSSHDNDAHAAGERETLGPQWTEVRPDRLSIKLFDISVGVATKHISHIDDALRNAVETNDATEERRRTDEEISNTKKFSSELLAELSIAADLKAFSGMADLSVVTDSDSHNSWRIRPIIVFLGGATCFLFVVK